MENTFTKSDFISIRKEVISKQSNFVDILFSETYRDHKIYILYYIENNVDKELAGAFFSLENAINKKNNIIAINNYSDIPLKICIDCKSIKSIIGTKSESRIIGWLAFDLSPDNSTNYKSNNHYITKQPFTTS